MKENKILVLYDLNWRNNMHNCNSYYKDVEIIIIRAINGKKFSFSVHGKRCEVCGEEVVHRDEVKSLEEKIEKILTKDLK